jgi:hypothetical protein
VSAGPGIGKWPGDNNCEGPAARATCGTATCIRGLAAQQVAPLLLQAHDGSHTDHMGLKLMLLWC